MNFKTPISTTREQSERLLALGVNSETADMYIDKHGLPCCLPYSRMDGHKEQTELCPAWSLGRLIDMLPTFLPQVTGNDLFLCLMPRRDRFFVDYINDSYPFGTDEASSENKNPYDAIIDMIECIIEKGYLMNDIYMEGGEL